MKVLHFFSRGEWHQVSLETDTIGQFIKSGGKTFTLPHTTWRVIGFSKHHMNNHPTIPITHNITEEDVKKTYVWDKDHGTTRMWMGTYPRIINAFITDKE